MRLRTCLCLLLLAGALAGPLALSAAPQAGGLPATEVKPEVRLQGAAPTVFERLGEFFGVPVKVEPDFPPRALRLRLRDADFATALRVTTQLAGAFWVLQPDGSVLVAADTPENRQRYEIRILKTFSLPGRAPEDLNEAVRLLREVLDMRLIRAEPRAGTVSVLDTPRRLAVAEQLLAQLEADPGEVWVEVLLLEVDREQAQELGILPPDQAIAVHLGAGALAIRDTSSLQELLEFLRDRGLIPQALQATSLQSLLAGGMLDPGQLAGLLPPFILVGGGATTFAANLPGAELRLSLLARVTRSWRRLHLRARAGEEASLFLGERFPVVFSTFSAIFIPAIVQELIRQGQFLPPVPAIRYEELGIRVTITPRVHSTREITLTFKLDQKALSGQEVNGIPVLVNREVEQQVRLREGETLILAGLRRDSQEVTRTATPGLGALPVIGRLFRLESPRTQKTELLILITPRLTRLPLSERLAARVIYIGTEKEFAPAGRAVPAPPVRLPQPRPRPPRPQQPQQQQPQPQQPRQPPRPPN